MIDKSLRKATAERFGDLVIIRMTGGGDCLWLNMVLDTKDWCMMADSDIGSYCYRWHGKNDDEDFVDRCIDWFYDSEWLLRKCVGEKRERMEFGARETADALIRDYEEEFANNGDDYDYFRDAIDYALQYDTEEKFVAALNTVTDIRNIELPEEWWCNICREYTPWQKRFAEICDEVIRPELIKMREMEEWLNTSTRSLQG